MRTFIVGLISIPALWAAPAVTTVCASGCDQSSLQTAINNAAAANSGPQIIVLKAGENFDTATGFTLPARSGSYTGWITLRSSRVSELPAKTRVAPTDAAKMATLRVTAGGYTPVLYTSGHPSSYWQLEGLEFTLSATSLGHQGWLIGIGQGMDSAETEPSKVSHHIVIDRCYIHGIAFDNGPRDGIRVNGDNVQVLNSYISEIKRDDDETHAILGYSLNGPLLIRNTFHGGAAIGSLIGGALVANASIRPNHLQFLGNHYQKTPTHRALRYEGNPQGTSLPAGGLDAQPFWKTDTSEFYIYQSDEWRRIAGSIAGNVCVDGDFWEDTTGPSYFICSGGQWISSGSDRTVTGGTSSPFNHFWSKNGFELKAADGALVEGNLIENCFSPTDGYQACSAFLFNFFPSQSGTTTSIRDVMVRNNLVRRTGSFIQQGSDATGYSAFSHRVPANLYLENNLWEDSASLTVAAAINKFSYYWSGSNISTQFGQFGLFKFSNQWVRHNTLISPFTNSSFYTADHIYSEYSGTSGVHIDDNIIEGGNGRNLAGSGGLCQSFSGWPGTKFYKNLMVNHLQSVISWTDSINLDWSDDCRSMAWPWKRGGTGLWEAPVSASISEGWLKILFTRGHGQVQGTKLKLAGWSPAGLNTTYTVPRYCCESGVVTYSDWQEKMWLPTAETGAVTLGTIEASVGYADWAARNFRLASTSAYRNWASDGADPGANQDLVEWATAGASSGADNPYLDFRVRDIEAASGGAAVRFTAYSAAACTWTISSTRAFADSLGSVSQSRVGRDGVAIMTGLAGNTRYWYRAACEGGRYRDGEFVTKP